MNRKKKCDQLPTRSWKSKQQTASVLRTDGTYYYIHIAGIYYCNTSFTNIINNNNKSKCLNIINFNHKTRREREKGG